MSVISGRIFSVSDVEYVTHYVAVADETAHGPENLVASAFGMSALQNASLAKVAVRVPFGPGELTAARRKVLVLTVVTLVVAVWISLNLNVESGKKALFVMHCVLWLPLAFLVYQARGSPKKVVREAGGRVWVLGLREDVMDKMVRWQHEHPEVYAQNTA